MMLPHGLGALPSPSDERDWQIDALYAAAGLTPVAAVTIPLTYLVPAPVPPRLDQGSSPMCVAFGNSTLKAYQDLRDTGPTDLDEARFFSAIGGTANGAVPRYALDRLLAVGYPELGGANAAKHKIAAYYAVPLTKAAIQSAILTFGPIGISFDWSWSWFQHSSTGVLPAPNATAGGHFIVAVGWDSKGLRLRNSWGTDYGVGGDVWMPWSYLWRAKEAWKTVDKILTPPPTVKYSIRLGPGAKILAVASFCGPTGPSGRPGIQTWRPPVFWGATASTAPCQAPQYRAGCSSGGANLVYVPTPAAAAVAGKWIRLGTGVTVVVRS
jgi:hypothetical protein